IRAAQLGARAVCIEKEPELGGTCLRVGCIPTKAWVQTAHAIHEAGENYAKFGVQVGEPQLDMQAANAWKEGVVKQMTSGVASIFQRFGSEVTIVEMLPTLIPQEDEDATKELAKQFKRRGITLHLGKQCTQVDDQGSHLTVHFGPPESAEQETVDCDLMLVSV